MCLTLHTAKPGPQTQTTFLLFLRFNVKTFTTLLRVYYGDLQAIDLTTTSEDDELDLATRVTAVSRSILPALRLYSSWLLTMTPMLAGLTADDLLGEAIDQFWPIYAKVIDLVAAIFPIWDLEDLDEITYMLEEDADTIEFKPLQHARTKKIWNYKTTGQAKPRFSDHGVERASADLEMLARVREFLTDGLFLANDDDSAPIKLRGTRILHRDAEEPEVLPPIVKPAVPAPKADGGPAMKPAAKAKPLSYAAAAATKGKKPERNAMPNSVSSTSSNSRHAQLSRMVDDLVDDDDSNNPVTPPQQPASNPAVVTRADVSYSALPGNAQNFAQMPNYAHQPNQKPIGSGPGVEYTPPALRTPKNGIASTSGDRMQSVSSLWNDTPASTSSNFPPGLPTGTLGSPANMYSRGHSRVNSASSIRSRTSQNLSANVNMNTGIADSWSSIESAPRAAVPNGLAPPFGAEPSNVASPLLFGAGESVWSTSPNPGRRDVSPSYHGGG